MDTFNKEVDIPEVEEDNIEDIIREQGIDIGSTHTEHNKENNYEWNTYRSKKTYRY